MNETQWTDYEWLEYEIVLRHGLGIKLREWRQKHNIC